MLRGGRQVNIVCAGERQLRYFPGAPTDTQRLGDLFAVIGSTASATGKESVLVLPGTWIFVFVLRIRAANIFFYNRWI